MRVRVCVVPHVSACHVGFACVHVGLDMCLYCCPVPVLLYLYSVTGLESRKLFSFAKTIHLMCISILPSLDAVPYICDPVWEKGSYGHFCEF